MTIIDTNRDELDERLGERVSTVLLLSDEDGDLAERIHDVTESVAASEQYVYLLRDLRVLTTAEKKKWFDDGGHYAVFGGSNRVVAVRGMLDEFLLSDKSISKIEIRAALGRGDRLP